MTALGALTLAWKHREKAAYGLIVVLLVVIYIREQHVAYLNSALVAKPRIVTKVVTKVHTKIIQGPERIVEKIIIKPGGERIIIREIFREPVVTETGSQMSSDTLQDPVVALEAMRHRPKRWLVGAAIAPVDLAGGSLQGLRSLRAGITFRERIDLTYAYEFHGAAAGRHRAEIAFRF